MRGIGTDIIEIERIEKLLQKKAFLQRVFTPIEQNWLCAAPIPAQTGAGMFCAKEAVAKAMGTGLGSALSFRDIEILHNSFGAPYVVVAGYEGLSISVSISHCRTYATAVAVLWEE